MYKSAIIKDRQQKIIKMYFFLIQFVLLNSGGRFLFFLLELSTNIKLDFFPFEDIHSFCIFIFNFVLFLKWVYIVRNQKDSFIIFSDSIKSTSQECDSLKSYLFASSIFCFSVK